MPPVTRGARGHSIPKVNFAGRGRGGAVVEVLGTRIMLGLVNLIRMLGLKTTKITRQIKL